MPTAKEFTISLEDKPGTLGKLCQALAEGGVNILAYQQFPHEKGKGSVRLVVDNPDKAKAALDRQRSDYKETDVAQVKMAHRPGELGRASSRLGDAGININYGYCGTQHQRHLPDLRSRGGGQGGEDSGTGRCCCDDLEVCLPAGHAYAG